MFYFVIGTITLIVGVELWLGWQALRAAPLCTCNDPRCGGGCIDWDNANG